MDKRRKQIRLLFTTICLVQILCVHYLVKGSSEVYFTHIYVTYGNGTIDLIGGGAAKIYVGQTPNVNLTVYNAAGGILGATLLTKLNGVSSPLQYIWKGTSYTFRWLWSSPITQSGTYAYQAELWWRTDSTYTHIDTKTFYIIVVELKIVYWKYDQTSVQRGSGKSSKLTVSFSNGGNDDMSNVKLEIIDPAGLDFASQVSYLGSISSGATTSSSFDVTAPSSKPVGSYTIHFRVSYDDFMGNTHTEEETATIDVVNIATKLSLYSVTSITYGDTLGLTAYLYDRDNYPIPSQTIKFLMNGTQIGTAVTDTSGKATYTITSILDAGTYLLQVGFEPTQDYSGATTQPSTLQVLRMNTQVDLTYIYGMKIGKEEQISAVLKDGKARALSGQEISFYLDNTIIGSSTTDQTGIASIRYTPTTAGTYTLKAVFSGSRNYQPSSGANPVVIAAFSVTILTQFPNAPIITVNGVKFTTDNNGKVVVQVQGGRHTVSVAGLYSLSPGTRARFIKWADGTSIPSVVLTVSSDMTVSAQYAYQYLVNIVFQDANGARTVMPDSIITVAPNASSKTFTSYSSLWLDGGQWTISSIFWKGIDVELDNYRTLYVNTPGQIDVRCAIYDVAVTVQDVLGLKISGAMVDMALPDGSTQEQVTSQTGTVLFTSVPRGRYTITVTNLGLTTAMNGDTSASREVVISVLMSTNTLITMFIAVVIVGSLAYLIIRRRHAAQSPMPPPPPNNLT